jgi:hypothetical protein
MNRLFEITHFVYLSRNTDISNSGDFLITYLFVNSFVVTTIKYMITSLFTQNILLLLPIIIKHTVEFIFHVMKYFFEKFVKKKNIKFKFPVLKRAKYDFIMVCYINNKGIHHHSHNILFSVDIQHDH